MLGHALEGQGSRGAKGSQKGGPGHQGFSANGICLSHSALTLSTACLGLEGQEVGQRQRGPGPQ